MRAASVHASTACDTAASLIAEKRFDDAEAMLRDAAQRARADADAAGLYLALQALAELLRSRELRVEAVPVFLEALAACREAQGSADELGRLEASLAFTLVNLGLPDEANDHAAAALALAEATTRLDERIRALNAVALTSTRMGHFRAAKRLYAQIVREGRGAHGAAEGERGRAIINLGVCLNDEARTLEPDDPRRARLLRRQIACNKAALTTPLRPGNGLAAMLNTTEALLMLGRHDDACRQLAELDATLQASPDTELHAFAVGLSARVAMQRGDMEEAATLFKRALSLFDAVGSSDEVPGLLEALSQCEESQGQLGAALAAERRASAMRRARALALNETRVKVVEARYEIELARRAAEAQRTMEARIAQQQAQLRAQTDAMSLAARTDPLTGLGNRRVLEEMAKVLSEPSGLPFSVAVLDADHFKQVNDRFSHAVGDQVLRQIADILRDNCRPTDVAARYGGEEFVLVLPGMTRDVALRVCERLRERVASFDWNGIRAGLAVTVSIGIGGAVCPAPLNEVIERADSCLYAAKKGGRNQVRADTH